MAKLYFTYAAMNAGKSTILLQAAHNYRERGMNTLLFTSALYADEAAHISSRIGLSAKAELFSEGDNLLEVIRDFHNDKPIHCVFVDEAQFLSPDQVWQLARVADRLDIPVLCYGLRTDFLGNLFPGSAQLLAIADHLREARTICETGHKATMTLRLDEQGKVLTSGDQVSIEKASYQSVSRRVWEDRMGRWPPNDKT